MSDIKDEVHEKILQEIAMAKKIEELKGKKFIIESRRVDNEMRRITQSDKDLALTNAANLDRMTPEQIDFVRQINREYIMSARNKMLFINKDFDGIVPYFPKNIILMCGTTGTGKSTTVANVTLSTIVQKNEVTGKGRRVLIVTNEERTEDVYNRVTCLIKGWQYTNHDEFSNDQLDMFDAYIKRFAETGQINVIDNNYNGATGVTTTIEGIESIMENLIKNEIYYDVILFDYYQNIKGSITDPRMNEYEVQARFANMLDKYKNVYPAAFVVMAQVNPPRDSDDKTPLEYRIKGRKVITDPATFIVEMKADRENLRTAWTVHKSRFTRSVGETFFTGYDKGKFVPYTADFARKVNAEIEGRNLESIERVTEEKREKLKGD